MRLNRIYSNNPNFNKIYFNSNFNIILGLIENDTNYDDNAHNLGKSVLIELIDFLFLKELKKGNFLKNKNFAQHVFFLELKIKDNSFITIKRAVNPNTKVSIKMHSIGDKNFIHEKDWDYKNLLLTTKVLEKNPKEILNTLLGFNILSNLSYRQTLNYFFRTQDDYNSIFKLNKYKGGDIGWKPILYELLGFDSTHMIKKYQLEKDKENKNNLIKKYKNEFNIDQNEIDKINSLIELSTDKKNKVINQLDSFNFYEKEAHLNKEIISNLELKIAKLNSLRYKLDYEINQIKNSLNEPEIIDNLDEVIQLYQEANILFNTDLRKSYKELIEFNNKILHERKEYLEKVYQSKNEKRNITNEEIIHLNLSRSEALKDLTDTDTFAKYNSYRDDLIILERELEGYSIKIKQINQIDDIQIEVDGLDLEIKNCAKKLKDQIKNPPPIYKKIKKDFHTFVNFVLGEQAILTIKSNTNDNIEFEANFIDPSGIETQQSDGYTYKKLLCACFDLAILKNYKDYTFYKTIYHDGILESLDPRKQTKFLTLVNKLCIENNFQYILTSLSSDIPKQFKVNDTDIILRLTDKAGDSERLFGFSY